MIWSRPNGSPKIWSTFERTTPDGKTLRFTIQEIPEDRRDDVVEHMLTIFFKCEPLCISMNIIDDQESVQSFRDAWKKIVDEGISIVAFEESEHEKPFIAGVNILSVSDKNADNELIPIFSSMSKAEKMIKITLNTRVRANTCARYGVDLYLCALGLSVHSRYRRLGLGKRLLETRKQVGQAYGLPVTSTFFSSAASQGAAAAAGFNDCFEQLYDEIVDEKGELIFPDLKGKSLKVMDMKLI